MLEFGDATRLEGGGAFTQRDCKVDYLINRVHQLMVMVFRERV